MPPRKLDTEILVIRELTGLLMTDIRSRAMEKYISEFDFKGARHQKEKQRRDLIRYAIKKHGSNAAKVLSKMRVPVKYTEREFYNRCMMDRRRKNRLRGTGRK